MAGEASARPGQVFLYFGPPTLLVYLALPHAYLVDITTTYMRKDQLHGERNPQVEAEVLAEIGVAAPAAIGG